jgi:hypothetical protein
MTVDSAHPRRPFDCPMSPIVVNGRTLVVENQGDVGAARAWNDARAAYIAAGGNPWDFEPVGPNSSARSRNAQYFFYTHQPVAAFLYTSNHGWGLAVDVETRAAAAWLMQNGLTVAISHDEGQRVGEWWRLRYIGGYAPRRVGLAHLTEPERQQCRELDRLRRERRDLDRRRRYRSLLARTTFPEA